MYITFSIHYDVWRDRVEKKKKQNTKKRGGERAKKKMNTNETVIYHWHFDVGKKIKNFIILLCLINFFFCPVLKMNIN